MKNLSDEQVRKIFAKREAQKKEIERLNKKVEEYSKKINDNTFSITINWETNLPRINLKDLFTDISDEILDKFPNQFYITYLDLDKVANYCCSEPDTIYPKDNIWKNRNPHAMARLIEYVEKNKNVIPIMIRPVSYNQISIMDGHHRLALARFLYLKNIPFLVEKESESLLNNLNL